MSKGLKGNRTIRSKGVAPVMLVVLFSLVQLCAFGQQFNLGIFVVPVKTHKIKSDGILLPDTNRHYLKPGSHKLEIWAPHHHKFDTTVVTNNDKPIGFAVALKPTRELIEYREAMKNYKSARSLRNASASLGIVVVAASVLNYTRIGSARLEQVKAVNGVEYGIVGYNEDILQQNKNRFKATMGLQYSLYALAGLCFTKAIVNTRKLKKMGKPILREDNSFIVENIGLLPDKDGMNVQLTIRF